MALRIPKAELAPELAEPMTAQFGAVPEPLEVVSHNRKVAGSALQFSVLIGGWDTVAEDLKTFSHMAVAAQVGCSWCLDINYFQAQNYNLDMAKASQMRWREADVFTSLERDVLEYSEAMTNTPPTRTTCSKSRGCGGPGSTRRRCSTRGHTSSAPSPARLSTGCAPCRAGARTTSVSGCPSRC
jgi:alkylhydroperoxidase family enzyme